jgi:hypothetical protein
MRKHIVYKSAAIGPQIPARNRETGKAISTGPHLQLLHSHSNNPTPWHDHTLKITCCSLQGRMPKLPSHSRSLRLALQPSRAAGRSVTSSPRRTLAHPRHGILNDPWLPAPSTVPLPTAYFSPTGVRKDLNGLGGGPGNNDHKPPDERVLKLGKSEC